ncbi:MAG: hypothetical protein HGA85_02720 [Nanoarchaeota archaeon]|nr:hypothetical protein [Nanoarchaeota archaeon]
MKTRRLLELLTVLLFCAILLYGFQIVRLTKSPYLPTYYQYENLEHISYGNDSGYMPDIQRDMPTNLLDIIMSKIGNTQLLVRLLPPLIGLINIMLLFFIVSRFAKESDTKIYLLSVLLSPVFLYYHVTYNNYSLGLTFALAGAYLLMSSLHLLAMISLILSFLVSPDSYITIFIIIIMLYSQYNSKKNIIMASMLLLLAIAIASVSGLASFRPPSVHYALKTTIFDLGALPGFGIFHILLSGIGIIRSWREKEHHILNYIIFLILAIMASINKSYMIYLDIILCYFCGYAIAYFINSQWESSLLRTYVTTLIMCGILFSGASFLTYLSRSDPNDKEMTGLRWLSMQEGGGNILTHYTYGGLIRVIAKKTPYIDTNYVDSSRDKLKLYETNRIFGSRDMKEVISFLEKNNIRYIMITEEMKHGLVWTKDEDGMLLLLQNTIRFAKVYDYLGTEIYLFIPIATR